MDFHHRIAERSIEKWLSRGEGVLLYGARQVGKSTIFRYLADKIGGKYYSFDEEATFNYFKNNPQGALEQAILSSKAVFIDEFQKLPEITKAVKYLYDKKKPKFFLSGSISDSLVKGGDSMVGRVIRIPLFTLSFREYMSFRGIKAEIDFDINNFDVKKLELSFLEKGKLIEAEFKNYLLNGGYPATVGMDKEQLAGFFQSIKSAFLEKDILGRLRSGMIGNISTLAVILAKRVGFPLSLNALANEVGVDIKTIKRLLDILKYSYWIEVVYSKAEFGSEFKNKFKVYFLDNGLRNFLAGVGEDVSSFEEGPVVENCVFGILRRMGVVASFWHTYGGGEVDFVASGEAFEVKAAKYTRAMVPLSLSNYIKKYKVKRAFVLNRNYFGETKVLKTPVYFLPIHFFALAV